MKRTIIQTLFALSVALSALGAGVSTNWERTASAWDSGIYTYDGAGNIVQIGTDAYGYDAAGRLVTGTAKTPGYGGNLQSYAYDRHGNMKSVTTNGVVAQLAPDPKTNRLPGVSYDDAGNQLGLAGTYVTYAYDSHGMMTTRTDVGPEERYIYDANDERIVSVRSGGTRLYTLRGLDQKVIREVEHDVAAATWTWKRDYVHRGSTLLASYVGGEPGTLPQRHYHVDHLGTPRMITSAEGYKLKLHTYWPFGSEAPGSELDSERLKFTGHERDQQGDPARELDYMHARYYGPGWGRFLTVDPTWASADAGKPQSWNRYAYVRNNPMNYPDPDGRDPRISRFFRSPFGKAAEHLSKAAHAMSRMIVVNPAVRLAGTGGSAKAGPFRATATTDIQLKAKSTGELALVANAQVTSGRAGAEAGQRLTATGTIYPTQTFTVDGSAITQTGAVTEKASTNFQLTVTGQAGPLRLEAGVDVTEMRTFVNEIRAAVGTVVDETTQVVEETIEESLPRITPPDR
jgi:RHS repeat-associated protein